MIGGGFASEYYYTSGYYKANNTQKKIQKSKFSDKLMVCLAIGKKDCSKPYSGRQSELYYLLLVCISKLFFLFFKIRFTKYLSTRYPLCPLLISIVDDC